MPKMAENVAVGITVIVVFDPYPFHRVDFSLRLNRLPRRGSCKQILYIFVDFYT